MSPENQSTTLVIDSHCVGHIAKYSSGHLSYGDTATGTIFGFLLQIYRLAKKFNTIDFVFTWDSKVSRRAGIFKEYQFKRKHAVLSDAEREVNLEFRSQLQELREDILPALGFRNMFRQSGYESDDLIAKIVMKRNRKFVIVGTDHDLYQLLDYSKIYDTSQKKMIDSAYLFDKWGISPEDWIMVKAIAGCGSDGVPGIVGVAEKTATKYLRKELKKGVALERIKASNDIIQRNLKLVKLPLEGTEDINLYDPPEYLNYEPFYEICDRYGFVSILRELHDWKAVLKLERR